jgi:hypothetical protein
MSNVLTKANNQWASRPADERFGSIAAMHDRALASRTGAAVAKIKADALRLVAQGDDLQLQGPTGQTASLTNWSYRQVASRAGAPVDYITTLPAPLAAECLNTGLRRSEDSSDSMVLFDKSGPAGLTARAMTSDKYSRIWNADITARLLELEARGPWQPAPAAFDGSRGLYLGDRDMFAFLVDNNRRIFESGPAGGLSRGFFIWNSEVGASSFGIMTFLYEYVCGNHRVWGVSDIAEMRIIHIGRDQQRKAFDKMTVELRKYADASAAEDEAKVTAARRFVIGANKDEILDELFKLKAPGLTRKLIGQSYDLAEKRVDWYGNPRTAWGMAGAITEIARDLPYAADRNTIELAATKVMEMAF